MRWQEYTEELYRKGLNDPRNHNGVVTHQEPDILECEVKWALGIISMNKASRGDVIPAEIFRILKDDAVKVLHSICQQIWKTQQWTQDWKRSVFIPIPKKGNAKECSNYHTIVLFHMLVRLCSKFFKLGFSSMLTENFQMYKLGLEKAEEPEIKLPTFIGAWRKQGNSIKTSISASLTMLKSLCDHNELWKVLKEVRVTVYLTYHQRNLCVGQEATVRTLHGKNDWDKTGKGVCQGCILSPCLTY